MHVTRIGLTPLKGARHADLATVDLTPDGPVGDRVFCLVDPARGRVLRTVEHPSLVRTTATWQGGVLACFLPGHADVVDVPVSTGETLKVDYWGRWAGLEVIGGPWAAAYSAYLGLDVVLARALHPGEVVYAGSVSLVTTSSLDRLAQDVGPVDAAQFRATFTVDTSGEAPYVEDSWAGRRLRVGTAEVEVRGGLPRCAVVDRDPLTGAHRCDVLQGLADARRVDGGILFGVDAVVVRPGRVDVGSSVERG